MPKSMTFGMTSPSGARARKRFAGFTSRCTTPARCAASSAARGDEHFRRPRGAARALARGPRREVFADEELLREVEHPGLVVDAHVEHLDDVAMRALHARAGLAAKALHGVGVVGDVREQGLERDASARPRVNGLVDGAHSAATDDADRLVTPSDHRVGARRRWVFRGGVGHRVNLELGRDITPRVASMSPTRSRANRDAARPMEARG
ncbi:MAG: hypothetical protein U0326_28365 [Polyangiales bacterium]